MRKAGTPNTLFEEIDANQDGTIDKHEFDRWATNSKGAPSTCTSYEVSTSATYGSDHYSGRHDRTKYDAYGAVALTNDVVNAQVIETHSLEETNEYLDRAVNIYRDPHPEIIRRPAPESAFRHEQRIFVRYLQPPELPAPGPLIIKEVRAPQPPPPPPLVIRQYAQAIAKPPPLILRERPPTPPPQIRSETVVRQLPALPVPPRSVIIERFAAAAETPRDIIIERWLPYGPQPERRRIVERADEVVTYPEPHNKIIIYEAGQAHVTRQFEKDGVVPADPENYIARHGATLLESETLVRRAREVGVHEDISVPARSSLTALYGDHTHTHKDHRLFIAFDRYDVDTKFTNGTNARRQGTYFDYVHYGLFPAGYSHGMKITRKFVRPANFTFPPLTKWSTRIAKYREQLVNGRVASVTVELIENGAVIHIRTITEEEYQDARVSSSAPKLPWNDFLQVLQVFMMGGDQERESDINRAFDILDQGKRGLFGRPVSLPDGIISPDELRAFLSILTDEYRVDLCVYLADTNESGEISMPEFVRMVKSGLARDVVCECILPPQRSKLFDKIKAAFT